MFYILRVMHTLMLNFSLRLQPAVGLPTKITCMQDNCNKSFSTPYNFHQHLCRHTNTFHFFVKCVEKDLLTKTTGKVTKPPTHGIIHFCVQNALNRSQLNPTLTVTSNCATI